LFEFAPPTCRIANTTETITAQKVNEGLLKAVLCTEHPGQCPQTGRRERGPPMHTSAQQCRASAPQRLRAHAFVAASAHIVNPAGMPFGFMPMEFMPPPPAPAFFSFFSTMIACNRPQSSGLNLCHAGQHDCVACSTSSTVSCSDVRLSRVRRTTTAAGPPHHRVVWLRGGAPVW